jgi:hypothetical protein
VFLRKSARLATTKVTTSEAPGTLASAIRALAKVMTIMRFLRCILIHFPAVLDIGDKPVMKCETVKCNQLICAVGEELITAPEQNDVCCPKQACSASQECGANQKPQCQQDQELHQTNVNNCTDFVCCKYYIPYN